MKRAAWRLVYSGCAVGGALGLLLWIESALASPDAFLSVPEASNTVAVRNVSVRDDVVSGEIVNMSPRPLRDVQLLIRRIWHWENEFRPGQNPPGSADYYTVDEEITPGGTRRFTYRLPSHSRSRSDGHFETTVTVAGFAAIEQQRTDGDRRPAS